MKKIFRKKTKVLSLVLIMLLLMSPFEFVRTVSADPADEWKVLSGSFTNAQMTISNGEVMIGAYCLAKNITGTGGTYAKTNNTNDGSFGSQLDLSEQALREIRYAVAEIQSNFKGSTFNQDLAASSFPTNTLSRTLGKSLAQDLVWYRQYMDNPSKYPEVPIGTQGALDDEEKEYFYHGDLEIGDTLGVEVSKSLATEKNGYWGPYKISYAPGSSQNLIEINNSGINKDILPTFSVEGDGVAYLYDGNTMSSTKLTEVPMDTEFYIWPIKSGTNTVRVIPNSTIITEIKDESIFESEGFQPLYGLEFSTYEDFFEIEVTRTIPEVDYRVEKMVTNYWDSLVGDYDFDISVPRNSRVLYRMETVVENTLGADIVLPAKGPSNPVKIFTAEQLANINNDLNSDYILMNNIDLDKYLTVNTWTPIGSTATPFKGTFDGNGYTIANLLISTTVDEPIGLFGVSNGTIKNLAMDRVTITGVNNIGSIAGISAGNGGIENCVVKGAGTLRGTSYVGVIAGRGEGTFNNLTLEGNFILRAHSYLGGILGLAGNVTVRDCLVKDRLQVAPYAPTDDYVGRYGGIIGAIVPSTPATVTVENCHAANLKFQVDRVIGVGGIVGQVELNDDASNAGSTVIINNCSVVTDNPEPATAPQFSATYGAGGILGSNVYSPRLHGANASLWSGNKIYAHISNCSVKNLKFTISGNQMSISDEAAVGGIAGTATSVSNCYADIYEMRMLSPMLAGGIVGIAKGNVTDCSSTGYISRLYAFGLGSMAPTHYSAGGIVARAEGAVERCISKVTLTNEASGSLSGTIVLDGYYGIGYSSVSGMPITNSIAANDEIRGKTNQEVYKVGSADVLGGNLSYDEMIVSPNSGGGNGESTVNGLATTWADLIKKSTYESRGYDFANKWNEPDGGLPTLKNLGPTDMGAIGADIAVTPRESGTWAKVINTTYITDKFVGSALSTAELLDVNLNPYDENGEGLMVHVPGGERLTMYYLSDKLLSGDYKNELKAAGNVFVDNVLTPFEAKASAIARVDDNVVNKVFYVDVEKFGDDIRNPLTGSEFTLYKYNSATGYQGSRVEIAVIKPEDSKPVRLLTAGYYVLKETANPAGYLLDDVEYKFLFNGNRTVPETIVSGAGGYFEFKGETIILKNINVSDGKLTVKKIWEDENSSKRPASISVQLYKAGIAEGTPIVLNANNNWTYIWQDLPYEQWSVDEISVPSGYQKTVTNFGNVFTITNSLYSSKPYTSSDLKISKVVTGAGDKEAEFDFVIELEDDKGNALKEYFAYTNTDNSLSGGISSGESIKLKDGESIFIHDIPCGTKYRVIETKANQDGYITTAKNDLGTIINGENSVEFTNHKPSDEKPDDDGNEGDDKKDDNKKNDNKNSSKNNRQYTIFGVPITGDTIRVVLFVSLLVLSGAAAIVVIRVRRFKRATIKRQ